MAGGTVFVAGLGFLIIVVLIIKVALLNARIDGYQEAFQHMPNPLQTNGGGGGCLQALAIIGFIAICGVCILVGMAM